VRFFAVEDSAMVNSFNKIDCDACRLGSQALLV
jgi:hypothetical protein